MGEGMELNAQTVVPTPVHVWRPVKIDEAWKVKERFGKDAYFIAGGTLLQLQREQGIPFPAHLISLEQVEGLSGIKKEPISESVSIGAAARLTECIGNSFLQQNWPLLAEAVSQVAAPAVRNRATFGGNIAYGIGDTIPALLALDAEVCWFNGKAQKEPLLTYLYKTMKAPRLLTAITLPETNQKGRVMEYYQKVGRREAFIPSIVTVAFRGVIDPEDRLLDMHIVAGGGASKPQRLFHAERILQKNKLTDQLLPIIHEAIMEEYQPVADGFASAEYRKKVAANLIVHELEKHTAN